jgi:integrase
MIKASNFSKDDAKHLITDVFKDLVSDVDDGFVPATSEPDMEIAEQRACAQDRMTDLSLSINEAQPHPAVRQAAAGAFGRIGLQATDLPVERQRDVYHGITRAMVEQQRLFLLRLEDRLASFVPADGLFAATPDLANTAAISSITYQNSSQLGPTLEAAVEEYLAAGKKRWTAKTLKSRERMLRYLVEHTGADRSLGSVTAQDVRSFRDAVRRLRSNHHRSHDLSFAGKQTGDEAKQIAPKTASLIFEPAKAFFFWAKSGEGLIAHNPAADIRMEVPKKAHAAKSRRPFTAGELKVLFTSPVFTGSKSVRRRLQPGSKVFRDAYFWLPTLGFYTGARLGELVQLHLDDLDLDGPIPIMNVTDENAGEVGSDMAKHVKSSAGVRRVPLHPDPMEIGFAEFVRQRRKASKGKGRLFREISFGADGQASTIYSKWFGRLLDVVGLTDRALVFHSFRHGVEDALRDALQPQYVVDRIVGHSDGSVSSQYGNGVSDTVKSNAVTSMMLPVSLVPFLVKNKSVKSIA